MKKLLTILTMAALLSLEGGQVTAAEIKIDAEKLTNKNPEGCPGDLLKLKVKNNPGTDFTGLTGDGFFLNACAQPQPAINLTVTGSSINVDGPGVVTLTGDAELEGFVGPFKILIDLDDDICAATASACPGGAGSVDVFALAPPRTTFVYSAL